jgi:hypothetical protein
MCGLAGIYNFRSLAPAGRAEVERMTRISSIADRMMKASTLQARLDSDKSNFRVKYRSFFDLNTATNPLAFVSFFLFDLFRITGHFFLRLRFR